MSSNVLILESLAWRAVKLFFLVTDDIMQKNKVNAEESLEIVNTAVEKPMKPL
jgi:hypothetical protein